MIPASLESPTAIARSPGGHGPVVKDINFEPATHFRSARIQSLIAGDGIVQPKVYGRPVFLLDRQVILRPPTFLVVRF